MIKYGLLHNHTTFSLHDSPQTPEQLVARAKELGAKNVTLTDHGTLLGIDDFMHYGEVYDVNTIPGIEAYLDNKEHFIIVAKNYEGYQSICYATKEANKNIESISKRLKYPKMTKEVIEKYFGGNNNVFCTSACVNGPIANILKQNIKIQKAIDKEQEKLNKLDESMGEYQEVKEIANKLKESIDKHKAYIKDLKTILSPAYKKKMEVAKQNAGQMTMFGDSKNSYDVMKEAYDNAKKDLKYHEAQVKMFQEKLKDYKSILTKANNAYKKREDIQNKINEYQLKDEDEIYQEALSLAKYYKDLIPNFYIELQYHGIDIEKQIMPIHARIARELGIPVIAANDAHLTYKEDCKARQILRFNYFSKHEDIREGDDEIYIKTDSELSSSLKEILDDDIVSEAMENLKVLDDCKVVFPQEKHYPKVTGGASFEELLAKARQEKIDAGLWNDEYEKRYNHEVNVITTMGYVDYHMVVRDFCNMARKLGVIPKGVEVPNDFSNIDEWIKEKGYKVGIGVGPGRGSAAGSLVCYLLGITNIDPLKYNLLFERFLNPERVSMPDIDSDITSHIRPAIIKYIKWKYGENAVCSIMTKTTYGAKEAIQTAGRDRASELYDNYPKSEIDELKRQYMKKAYKMSDLIPKDPNNLKDNEEMVLKEIGNDEESKLIWEHAKLIEGKLSGTGIHAGGVIISDNDNVNDYVALAYNEEKEVWAAQCDMIQAEEKGLLKMDLLGLNTLDVISDCVQLIEKRHGDIIDLDRIPFEDEVFNEIYAKGNTNSVFQFESGGMKDMLVQFKPSCFEDIVLLNAAYRPGPMQYLPQIIEAKHGGNINYLTPMLEDILSPTYGATIYQEQVMQIFQKLAGYSLGGADLVRRAMSKKKTEKLKAERQAFIYGDESRNIVGCVANGISEEIANELFDQMMDFAKYAFNKSHAAAYSFVSYQTAWLKYHYPVEFLIAMFNNTKQDEYGPIIADAKYYKIKLLPPDVNNSNYEFTAEDDAIRIGFLGIKGVGSVNAIEPIISARKEESFNSLGDFIERVPDLKKNIFEPIALSGGLDVFCKDREYSVQVYNGKTREASLIDLDISKNETSDYDKRKYEYKYVGTSVSNDPLNDYKEDEYYHCTPADDLSEGENDIMGVVIKMETKKTKKGNDMLIVTLETRKGLVDVLFFNEAYQNYVSKKLEGLVVKINLSKKDKALFGRKIIKLNPEAQIYCVELDTLTKFEQCKDITSDAGDNILLLKSWYFKGVKQAYPHMFELKISDNAVEQLKSLGYIAHS